MKQRVKGELQEVKAATMHLNDGQLRAHLDRELAEPERAPAAGHLTICPDCRRRLGVMEQRVARLSAHMALLVPGPAEAPRQAEFALAQHNARRDAASRKEDVIMPKSSRFASPRLRSVWVGLGVVAALTVALSFGPVRTWAGEFLGLFRVRQITFLPIDTTRISELNGDSTLGKQLSEVFSDSAAVTKEPGDPQVVADGAAAGRIAGFNVRLLGDNTATPQIVVQDGAAFRFVVDRARAQAILDEAGRSDLKLPASLDGATISVDIPSGVSAAYGDCPDLARTKDEERVARHGLRLGNCVILAQVPSPRVTTPPDVDVAQLAELGLQFIGMTGEEAHAFSQTVDWTSTLVVPIPRNGSSYEQVAVDGVTGNLVYRQEDDDVPARYTLLWVNDGIIYALTGFGSPDEGLAMANTLK